MLLLKVKQLHLLIMKKTRECILYKSVRSIAEEPNATSGIIKEV